MPITAAVIGDLRVQAVLAAHDMAAESRRTAALDRRHYLRLAEAAAASVERRMILLLFVVSFNDVGLDQFLS